MVLFEDTSIINQRQYPIAGILWINFYRGKFFTYYFNILAVHLFSLHSFYQSSFYVIKNNRRLWSYYLAVIGISAFALEPY